MSARVVTAHFTAGAEGGSTVTVYADGEKVWSGTVVDPDGGIVIDPAWLS